MRATEVGHAMTSATLLGAAAVAVLMSPAWPRGDATNRATTLRVHVDFADGHPAPGARVTVAAWHEGESIGWLLREQPDADLPSSPNRVQGVTDPGGDVALVPVSSDESCAVLATSPGERALVYVRWPERSSVAIRLHAPSPLTLHVRDAQDRPVGRARIGTRSSDGSAQGGGEQTDDSGTAVLEDLDLRFGAISDDETFDVLIDLPRGRGTAAAIPLPFAGPIDLRLEIPPTGSIRVDVADRRGKRIAAAGQVTLRDISKSDFESQRRRILFSRDVSLPLESDGTLTFDRVGLDGVYRFVGSLDGLGVIETTGDGPTRPEETTTIALVVDDDSPALTGHLVDEHGEPVRKSDFDCAIVEMREGEKDSRSPLPAIRTDGDGGFTVRPNPRDLPKPGERRFLELQKLGGRWIATFPKSGYYVQQCERFAQIEIPVDATVGRRVLGKVTLRDAVPLVRGRVVDRDRRPVIGASVSIHRSREEDDPPSAPVPWPNLCGTSDAEGAFEIVGRLPDGDYSLIAMASRERWSTPRAVPGEASDVELMVEPGGSLRSPVEEIPGLEVQLRLRRHDGSRVGRWSKPIEESFRPDSYDREYFASNIRRGVVDVAIGLGRHQGPFLPIRILEEVEIPSGAQASDRRLERIEVRSAMRTARIEVTAPPDVDDLEVGQLDEHGRSVSSVSLGLARSRRMNGDEDVPIVKRQYVCGTGAGSLPPPPTLGTARFHRTAQGHGSFTWNIDLPVAGDRWSLVVFAPERALLQIRDAAGPVTRVLPDRRRVPIRMNPGLSVAECTEIRASVRLVPKGICVPEFLERADVSFDGDEATVPLLATGPNDLVFTLHSADGDTWVRRTLVVDLPDRVEQPPISIPFVRELAAELTAEIERRQSH
jgi:hypothetical protein